MITCYVFGEIPGVHHSWTLAVMAVSVTDARQYVRATHRGGKLLQTLTPGSTVKASCGATTEAAQAVLHERMEHERQLWDEIRVSNPDWSDNDVAREISDKLYQREI